MTDRHDAHSGPDKTHFADHKDPAGTIAGETADRIFGLEPALQNADGASVLDIACHDGRIAERFAGAGATLIDGLDISETCIGAARDRPWPEETSRRFQVVDLSTGPSALEGIGLRTGYDLVLYLGIHHHLKNQMKPDLLAALENAIFSLATDHLAVRTPQVHFDPLLPQILEAGFEPASGYLKGNIAPVRHFRRISKSV